MSNYTKTVNFAAKDALTTGDANKVVKGTEIDTEFNNIATAVATKYDSSSTLPLSPVSGTLAVAYGGTGTSSGVPASIVQAGTFSTGTYALNSSSLLRVGGASPSSDWRFYLKTTGNHPCMVADMEANATASGMLIVSTANPTSVTLIGFATGYSSVYASISGNGTTINYGGTSDYRLKSNIQPLVNSIVQVKALKPCSYTWVKAPDQQNQGFLAHELAEVVPQAVVGEKDDVNADGSIKAQQVDMSHIVPLLTAALQEALVRIEALEAKVG